jgi:hypothetical protein
MFEMVGIDYPMIQLYRVDGSPISFPILTGEAGVSRDRDGKRHCYYPPLAFGTEVDEAAYGLTLSILETPEDDAYFQVLVAKAVKAGWKFRRLPEPGLVIEMEGPGCGTQVKREPEAVLKFLGNCLDPDGSVRRIFPMRTA